MFWFGIIIGLIIYGFRRLVEYRRDKKWDAQWDKDGRRVIREKKSNIIIEFIKAKYNKYCTKIEWIESDKK